MEVRNRSSLDSKYSGSFMFGATSPPVRRSVTVTPMLSRTSPLETNRPSSPTSARLDRRLDSASNTATKSRRKPPLSSVLDDGQIGSPIPINENVRASHQFTARGPDATPQHHHLFNGSPPPRTPGYELNVSLEDPFDRRDDSQFLQHHQQGSASNDFRSQFGSPAASTLGASSFQASAMRSRFAASGNSHNPMEMSLAQPFNGTGASFGGFDRQENGWNHWIMVSGYHNGGDMNSNTAILQRFQEYGTISRYTPGQGSSNWIFIRYDSPSMVERALCENGSFFNATTVISVTRLDPSIAKYMNLRLSNDGQTLSQEGDDLNKLYNSDLMCEQLEKTALIQRRTGSRRVTTRGKYEVEESNTNHNTDSNSSDAGSGDINESGLDSSIYLKPNRTKSICTKLVEYFFSY